MLTFGRNHQPNRPSALDMVTNRRGQETKIKDLKKMAGRREGEEKERWRAVVASEWKLVHESSTCQELRKPPGQMAKVETTSWSGGCQCRTPVTARHPNLVLEAWQMM